jgi:replicative DNA helicase
MPSAIESEDIVIRACLEGEKILNRVLEEVTVSMFYSQDNKIIYTAIKSLASKTRVLDDVLILKELKSLNLINSTVSNIICNLKDIYFNHNLDEHISTLS